MSSFVVMGANQNEAKTLHEKYFGADWINSIPAKWRAALRYFVDKTPGVHNDTEPDSVVDDVVSSELSTNRTNELERKTTRLNADLLTNAVTHGQELDETFDLVIPFTEHLSPDNSEVGDLGKQINPLNPTLSEVREVDTTAFDAVLEDYVLSFPGTSNVNAPDFLNSLTVVNEQTIGEGDTNEDLLYYSFTDSADFTIPYRSTAQGSAAISADVVADYTPIGGFNRSTIHYLFFLKSPVTQEQVRAKLATLTGLTVVSWPDFTPKPVTIVITSKRISLQVTASLTHHKSNSGDGAAELLTGGVGYSKEVGITTKTIRFPPMVHGDLDLVAPDQETDDITVVAAAGPASGAYSAYRQELSKTGKALYVISGHGLDATGGATTLPSSGLLIVDTNAAPYKYGWVRIQTEVIDASTL